MWRTVAALLLAAVVTAAAPASARMHAPYRGHRIIPANAAPLDGFTTPAGAYSFRKLKSTYAGPAVRLRRASDNAELDIGFLGCTGFTGCPIDIAAATTHCASTSCFVSIWYDQSGNARDTNRIAAQQPPLVFSCNGTLPCIQGTTNTHILGTTANYTPVMPTTFSAVGKRTAGTGACAHPQQFGAGNQIITATSGNWQLGGGGVINTPAAENTWHAASGVINGASSVLRVDAAETAGTVTGSTTAGAFVSFFGAASTTCNLVEVISWDGYAMAPAERAALQANQKSFWGTP